MLRDSVSRNLHCWQSTRLAVFTASHSTCRNVHRDADVLGEVSRGLEPEGTLAVSCRTIPGRCLARPALIRNRLGGPSFAPRPVFGTPSYTAEVGKSSSPPARFSNFFCDAFQSGSLEPHFYGASPFYGEAYGFSSGPVSKPTFDPTNQRVCSHWASCASRHLVPGDSAGAEHLRERGMDTTVASCWGAQRAFSARLFPLLRGRLTPLDSSGGGMEYSAIPTAATAPRFCARGHSCRRSSSLALPGCDASAGVQPRRWPSGRKPLDRLAMASGRGALSAKRLPACSRVCRVPVRVEIRSRWKVPLSRAPPGNRLESGGVSHR